MAAVGRLKFGGDVRPKQHEWLLRALACVFFVGYPWLLGIWLIVLAAQSAQGKVIVGNGFLIVVDEATNDPRPSASEIATALVAGVGLVAVLLGLSLAAIFTDFGLGVVVVACTLGAMLGSAAIRHRRDDFSAYPGAIIVRGFVATSKDARTTAKPAARRWLADQTQPVVWIADEGLKPFYESILSKWGVTGVLIGKRARGFAGHLRPARYLFEKP